MPKLLKTPFAVDAAEGFRTDIQESTGVAPNSATYQIGFPPNTMQSIAAGGMPPKGSDLNGVLYDITDNLVFLTQGGGYGFDSAYATSIGGYPLNAKLRLNDGTEAISTIANNTNDPNVNLTGWVKTNSASQILDESGKTQQEINDLAKSLRQFNIKDFGAKGDGLTNDSQAFRDASAAIEANGGGRLIIPYGTYIIGEQKYVNGQWKSAGYSRDLQNFYIHNSSVDTVIIESHGAKIKWASGLRWGYFNLATGAALNQSAGGNAMHIGMAFWLHGIKRFAMIGELEIDGNKSNQIIGGVGNSDGIQTWSEGVHAQYINNIYVENLYTHHHLLDGIYTSGNNIVDVPEANGLQSQTTLINVVAEYNGRQGWSCGGGSLINAIGGSFSYQSADINTGSTPRSGIDVEAENTTINNFTIIGAKMVSNRGSGLVADAGYTKTITIEKCHIMDNGDASVWCTKSNLTIRDSYLQGELLTGVDSTNLLTKPHLVENCIITDSQVGCEYGFKTGSFPISANAQGVTFNRCTFIMTGSVALGITSNSSISNCRAVYTSTYMNFSADVASLGGNVDGLEIYDNRTDTTVKNVSLNASYKMNNVSVLGNGNLNFYWNGDYTPYLRGKQLPKNWSEVDARLGLFLTNSLTVSDLKNVATWHIADSPRVGMTYGKGSRLITASVSSTSDIEKVCIVAGEYNTTAWVANTAYALGTKVNANGNVYKVTTAGTSSSSAPSGTSSSISDGTVVWSYVNPLTVFRTIGMQATGLTSSSTAGDIVAALKAAGLAT